MPLPYKVETLDDVPESARELYVEDGESYKLDVSGVESEDDVSGLKSALEKTKRKLKALESKASRMTDDDIEELEALRQQRAELEEKKAKEEGRFDELRTKLQEKHAKELDALRQTLTGRESVIERLTVQNELRAAIAEAGFLPEYHRAVEALLRERGPKVDWDGEMPRGVFPDDVEGDQPIGQYVKKFAASDDASPFMPPETGKGGGGRGGSAGGGGKRKSYEGKKYAEMSAAEKQEYLTDKYAEEAA